MLTIFFIFYIYRSRFLVPFVVIVLPFVVSHVP